MTNKSDLEKLPRYSPSVFKPSGHDEPLPGMANDKEGSWLLRSDVLAFFNNLKPESYRERLPDVRESVMRSFVIARPGHRNGDLTMDVTVGLYPDGRPGEIFIRSDYTGSFASGALDAVATALSMAWQYGVPFRPTVEKLKGMRFEPQGATGDPEYGLVTSPLDYVAKWLLKRFCGVSGGEDSSQIEGPRSSDGIPDDRPLDPAKVLEDLKAVRQVDLRLCLNCGLVDESKAVCRRCGDRRWSSKAEKP